MVWLFEKGFEINLSKTEFVKYLWVFLLSFCDICQKILSKKTQICYKYICFLFDEMHLEGFLDTCLPLGVVVQNVKGVEAKGGLKAEGIMFQGSVDFYVK